MLKAGLSVDNNFCHNALGFEVSKVDRPWCYFENGHGAWPHAAWGFCDVPTCDEFCGHHATEATTAFMTSTSSPKSIRPTKHQKGNKDPFVSCWNKCFNDGPENGSNCMNICMEVSLLSLTICWITKKLLRIKTVAIK